MTQNPNTPPTEQHPILFPPNFLQNHALEGEQTLKDKLTENNTPEPILDLADRLIWYLSLIHPEPESFKSGGL